MKLGFLGGTFDPPHRGHVEMARIALDSGQVDVVYLLPCWKHAFGKEPTSYEHRVNMCELAIKDEENMLVSDAEGDIQSTYSVEILEFLELWYHTCELRLIMGADNYWKMGEWKDAERVMELAPPLWVQRIGVKPVPDAIGGSTLRISSTEIRKWVMSGGEIPKEFTSPEVLEYIEDNGLYKWEGVPAL